MDALAFRSAMIMVRWLTGDVAVALSCKDRISLSAIVVKLPLSIFGQLRLENLCTHLGQCLADDDFPSARIFPQTCHTASWSPKRAYDLHTATAMSAGVWTRTGKIISQVMLL
jgi:hypothetical protein